MSLLSWYRTVEDDRLGALRKETNEKITATLMGINRNLLDMSEDALHLAYVAGLRDGFHQGAAQESLSQAERKNKGSDPESTLLNKIVNEVTARHRGTKQMGQLGFVHERTVPGCSICEMLTVGDAGNFIDKGTA